MAETKDAVEEWVARIQKTRKSRELLQILKDFRKGDWTDIERQRVSHTYMRVLDVILKDKAQIISKPEEPTPGNDGPVWYEKM